MKTQELRHQNSKLYILSDCIIMFLYKRMKEMTIDEVSKRSINSFISEYWSFNTCAESNIIPFESKYDEKKDELTELIDFNNFKRALVLILNDINAFINIIYRPQLLVLPLPAVAGNIPQLIPLQYAPHQIPRENQRALISKRNIKNILIDSFYESLNQLEDDTLMGYLTNANIVINNQYNVGSAIILKGGGALRLFDSSFKQNIMGRIPPPAVRIVYGEKISDIDVDLISEIIDVDTLSRVAILILDHIRTNDGQNILHLVNQKLQQQGQNLINRIRDKIYPQVQGRRHVNPDPLIIAEFTNYLQSIGIINGDQSLTSIHLLNLVLENKPLDTIVYRNQQNTYNQQFLNLLIGQPGKRQDPFDITFNKDLILCKASLSEFNLARLRVNFKLTFDYTWQLRNGHVFPNGQDQGQFEMILPIELYDIGISKVKEMSETRIRSGEYLSGNIDIVNINNKWMYSLMYNVRDLINVLYVQSLFPWDDKKYAKRIKRLMYYSTLYDLKCKSKAKVTDLVMKVYNTFNIIRLNFNATMEGTIPVDHIRSAITNLYLTTKTLAFNQSAFSYFTETNIQVMHIILLTMDKGMYMLERINYSSYLANTLGVDKCTKTDLIDDYIKKIEIVAQPQLGNQPFDKLRKHISSVTDYFNNICNILHNENNLHEGETIIDLINKLQ
jgi:hypothetical protein